MNAIEQVMVKRSSHFKLALAVIALVLVLWATGSSTQSLWLTPVIIAAGSYRSASPLIRQRSGSLDRSPMHFRGMKRRAT